MSEPQMPIPERPMVSASVTEDRRPSKPQVVDGSPPQTIGAYGCTPVQPDRAKRAIGRSWRRAKRSAVGWHVLAVVLHPAIEAVRHGAAKQPVVQPAAHPAREVDHRNVGHAAPNKGRKRVRAAVGAPDEGPLRGALRPDWLVVRADRLAHVGERRKSF